MLFACGCVCVLQRCDEVAYIGLAGAWDKRSMDTILGIPFSSIVKICNGTLITRKGPCVRLNNLLYVLIAKDDASLSIVAVSGGLAANTKSCSLNVGMSRT